MSSTQQEHTIGSLRNPIISGFNPDPSILRVGDDYFLATSTFEFFPGVPIYHSKDLVQWTLVGHALSRPSQLFLRRCEASMGIFAPTLRYHKGKYYVATCAVHAKGRDEDGFLWPRGFFVWTANIWDMGSWSDPIYFDLLGIDQDLFFDPKTTRAYLSVGKAYTGPDASLRNSMLTCYTVEIDIDSGRSLSEPTLCRHSTLGGGVGAEGPHIFVRGEYYYLITAEGGTEREHQEWVSRSKVGPLGPWELGSDSVNPIMYNGSHHEVRQTGHADIVEGTDGRWWLVFLAVRPVTTETSGKTQLSQLGRETFLASVEWVDDWPVVNRREPITVNAEELVRTPERYQHTFTFKPEADLFSMGWYRLRTPVSCDYSLTLRPGSLALRGGPYELSHNEAVTMFLQKQTSFRGTWQISIDYPDIVCGHEAGTAIWFSKWAYASLGLRGTEQGAELVFRSPNEDEGFTEEITVISSNTVKIKVEASLKLYAFYAQVESGYRLIGTLPSHMLHRTRSFDSVMTGTQMAIYAIGARQQASLHWAFFSEASWSGVREGGE